MGRWREGTAGARATPWPLVAAVGLAAGELGILAGNFPLAAAGLILFGGGVSGVAADAGYAASPTRSLVGVGVVFLQVGGGVWAVRAGTLAPSVLVAASLADGVARRGLAAVVGGALLVGLGAVAGRYWDVG